MGYSGNWYNGIVHDGEGNSGYSGVESMDERNREHHNWYADDPETADLVASSFFYHKKVCGNTSIILNLL